MIKMLFAVGPMLLVVLILWSINTNWNTSEQQNASSSEPINPTSSAHNNEASATGLSRSHVGWTTLDARDYSFQFSYPATSSVGLVPASVTDYKTNPRQPCNIRDATLFPSELRCIANLYYLRNDPQNQEDATIVISVATKDASASLMDWIRDSGQADNLLGTPTGTIEDTLAKAYAIGGELSANNHNTSYIPAPDTIINHNLRQVQGLSVLEFGAIVDGGGRLSYTTLLTRRGLIHVYSIELVMEYDHTAVTPSDNQYIDQL